jgi:hypothetical protein
MDGRVKEGHYSWDRRQKELDSVSLHCLPEKDKGKKD